METYNELSFTAPDIYDQKVTATMGTANEFWDLNGQLPQYFRLNIYSPTILTDKLLSPLAPNAKKYYRYRIDTIRGRAHDLQYVIRFIPKSKSFQLIGGYMVVSDNVWSIREIRFSGRSEILAFSNHVQMGEVGCADDSVNSDKEAVAKAVTAEAVKTAGYESLDAAKEDGTAFVFMGHGTSHTAKISYSQMQNQMNALGYDNVFIGTVEGEPEDTACEAVIEKIQEAGYKKVILRPLMVVAGDHANNDMAGDDEDSWKSQFEASGEFDSVDCQIAGLGGVADVEQLYIAHTKAAIDSLNG